MEEEMRIQGIIATPKLAPPKSEEVGGRFGGFGVGEKRSNTTKSSHNSSFFPTPPPTPLPTEGRRGDERKTGKGKGNFPNNQVNIFGSGALWAFAHRLGLASLPTLHPRHDLGATSTTAALWRQRSHSAAQHGRTDEGRGHRSLTPIGPKADD